MNPWKRARIACLLVLCGGSEARAQAPPSEPVVLAGGVLTVGGDISATFGSEDPGFFNYTDYEDSELRMLRVDVSAALRAGSHLSVLGEVRSQNGGRPRAYALYARVRPWSRRRFDIQVGRIPPTFGAFPRRSYESENPLIGYPLAYQYLTSIRPDAIPASADELLQMRGRGWLATYSGAVVGPTDAPGVPLVTAFRWDTGVQAHFETDLVDLTASITAGTLSNPRFNDDNAGRQVAGRVSVHPIPGLILGASAARGPFVSRQAVRAAGGDSDRAFAQTALGGDVEYSRNYYLVRFETVFSQWTVPALRPPLIDAPLRALATSVEGRYKVRPGSYVAARIDHLGFGRIAGSTGLRTWDAPVTRFEVGGGYSLQRNLLLKLATQFDRRDGGRIRSAQLVAGQLVFWF
jgi:hypothetical protein